MRITMMGTGYVGLTTGTCLANLGHDVICLDIDKRKIEGLRHGKMPIYEPGLRDLVERGVKEKRLSFTTDAKEAIQAAQVIFIAVGTPSTEDGRVNLSYIESAAASIGTYLNGYKVIVDKSTVPIGTADHVKDLIRKNLPKAKGGAGAERGTHEFDLVSNPEFLREGRAIKDFMNPDRIVIGCDNGRAKEIMHSIYRGIERPDKPVLFTDIRSAELIKYASNAFLATKISFINEVARLCEREGADVRMVGRGMGLDTRIGPRFLQAGIGYGGSCFPKDVEGLINTGREKGVRFRILEAVKNVNAEQRDIMFGKIKSLVPDLKGKRIAVWGLSFKPNTDDMREAPSVSVIRKLQKEGAKVVAFDPVAKETASKVLKDITYTRTSYDALKNADALVIFTEWDEFRNLDKRKILKQLRQANIIDGRNIYNPDEMGSMGFSYVSFGRMDVKGHN